MQLVPHRPRDRHAKSRPVHITMRARRGLPSFRVQLVHTLLLRILSRQRSKRKPYAGAFHVMHFSIQSNHLHVMVEANDKAKLRQNYRKHGHVVRGKGIVDRYSTAPSFEHWDEPPIFSVPLSEPLFIGPPAWHADAPHTWLLGAGWKDHYPLLDTREEPRASGAHNR